MANLLDVFKNPSTGKYSHSKIWANVACGAATYKFLSVPDMPSEIWAIYLGVVGGYAVARSFVAVKRQEAEREAARDLD